MIKNLIVNPEVFERGRGTIGRVDNLDYEAGNFDEFEEKNLEDKDCIWIGCPGRTQLNEVVKCLSEKDFVLAHLVAPELPCEPWYELLDQVEGADWFGVAVDDGNLEFWIVKDNIENVKFKPNVTWWAVKIEGNRQP